MKIYHAVHIEYEVIRKMLFTGKCKNLKAIDIELLSPTYKEFVNSYPPEETLKEWLESNPNKLIPLYNELKLINQ